MVTPLMELSLFLIAAVKVLELTLYEFRRMAIGSPLTQLQEHINVQMQINAESLGKQVNHCMRETVDELTADFGIELAKLSTEIERLKRGGIHGKQKAEAGCKAEAETISETKIN